MRSMDKSIIPEMEISNEELRRFNLEKMFIKYTNPLL